MFRLLRLIMILLAVGVCGVVSARALGAAVRLRLVELFTAPDGTACPQSCLFGVMPGLTTEAEARKLLRTHPTTRDLRMVSEKPFRLEGRADRIVMVSFNPTPSGIVDEITLATYVRYSQIVGEEPYALPQSNSLGEAVSLFGVPDFLLLTTGGDPLLMFTEAHIAVSLLRGELRDRHLAPSTSINRLTVFRYGVCPPDAFEYVFQDWRGLTSLRGYNRAKTLYLMVRRMQSQGVSFAPCR